MLEQFCDDFLAVVPLQLPELLDKRKMEKPVKYDDYVLLTFQLNTPFTTDERGMVSQIKVTIYDSLEHMSADVCLDLSLHCKNGFFKYMKPKEEVLLDFI